MSFTNGRLTAVEAKDCLAVLDEAIGCRRIDASRRIAATADARSPDEGLALLTAYISIADRRVRQAILDVLLSIAAVEDKAEEAAAEPLR